MDVSRIVSDAGAFSSLSKVKAADEVKPQEKPAAEEVAASDVNSSSDVVERIITEASANDESRDSLEKDPQDKGQIIDRKV